MVVGIHRSYKAMMMAQEIIQASIIYFVWMRVTNSSEQWMH